MISVRDFGDPVCFFYTRFAFFNQSAVFIGVIPVQKGMCSLPAFWANRDEASTFYGMTNDQFPYSQSRRIFEHGWRGCHFLPFLNATSFLFHRVTICSIVLDGEVNISWLRGCFCDVDMGDIHFAKPARNHAKSTRMFPGGQYMVGNPNMPL